MTASRLVSIVLCLQNEGKLSAQQLSERLEVSKRTILRDMEELSSAGIPVYAERGQNGGWRLTEGYRTSLTGMHAGELAALLLSSHAGPLNDLGRSDELESALQKLLAASSEAARSSAAAAREKLHIDGAGWHDDKGLRQGQGQRFLRVIQEAVWGERRLRIASLRDGKPMERVVHPLGLVVKRGVWYLVAALDAEEEAPQRNGDAVLRTFRIERLLNAEPANGACEIPPNFSLAAYWESSLKQFKEQLPRIPGRVRVAKETLPMLEGDRYTEIGEATPCQREGWLEAALMFQSLESAGRLALSCGAGIEVLEPEELRRFVADEIRRATVLYL
ncbi:helix-turn-helix transcriptional regulator [Paenibacillus sp. CAU 1782]